MLKALKNAAGEAVVVYVAVLAASGLTTLCRAIIEHFRKPAPQ